MRYSDHHGLASGEPKWEPGHLVERTEGLAGLIVSFWAAKGDPKAKGELPPPPPPRQPARPSSQGSDSGWSRSVGSQKRELEQKREQREKRQHVERANFSRFFTSQGSELDSQAMVQQLDDSPVWWFSGSMVRRAGSTGSNSRFETSPR